MVPGKPNTSELLLYKSSFGICRQDLLTMWLSAGPGRLRGCIQQSHKNKAQPSIPENGKGLRKCCHPSFYDNPAIRAGEMEDIVPALSSPRRDVCLHLRHTGAEETDRSLCSLITVFLYFIKWMFIAKSILSLLMKYPWHLATSFFLSGPIKLKCLAVYWHSSTSARPTSQLMTFPQRYQMCDALRLRGWTWVLVSSRYSSQYRKKKAKSLSFMTRFQKEIWSQLCL